MDPSPYVATKEAAEAVALGVLALPVLAAIVRLFTRRDPP